MFISDSWGDQEPHSQIQRRRTNSLFIRVFDPGLQQYFYKGSSCYGSYLDTSLIPGFDPLTKVEPLTALDKKNKGSDLPIPILPHFILQCSVISLVDTGDAWRVPKYLWISQHQQFERAVG